MQPIEHNDVINTDAAARPSRAVIVSSTLWGMVIFGATAALSIPTAGIKSPFWPLMVAVVGVGGGVLAGVDTYPHASNRRGFRWFLRMFWGAALWGAGAGLSTAFAGADFTHVMLFSIVAACAGCSDLVRGADYRKAFDDARRNPIFFAAFCGGIGLMVFMLFGEGIVATWREFVDGIAFTQPYVQNQPVVIGILAFTVLGAVLGTWFGLRTARRVRQQTENTDTLK